MGGSVAPTATVRLAAVASVATLGLLDGPRRSGTLLGVSDHAAWIGVEDDVVVLSDGEAVRLPNAIEIAVESLGRWIHPDDEAAVGEGVVQAGQLTAVARRWFDPRPTLRRCSTSDLTANLEQLAQLVDRYPDQGLLEGMTNRDAKAVVDAALLLLGRGAGLTPEGDDVLSAALSAHFLLAEATGRSSIDRERLASDLDEPTRTRTTSFSGTLIRHAICGRVAAPVADLLRALTDATDLARAGQRLLAVGHSSGPALAAGVLLGASSITWGLPRE